MSKILLLFLTIVLIFSGCASKANFSHTPVKQSDFLKPMETLKQEYSDISKYDTAFVFPQNTPKIEDLESIWGKSEKTKKWFEFGFFVGVVTITSIFVTPVFLVVYLFQPVPREDYIWKKENYIISVEGNNGLYVGYEKRMIQWEWKANDDNTEHK